MTTQDYDYIVVGGGSSGCVTAYRLVQDYGASVLLVEAGPRRMSPIMHMPAGYMKYLAKDTYLTMHTMTPQPQLEDRATIVPQARVLGGGSSVNAMVYMRGQPADYDRWDAELGGNSGWDYSSILPHFKRLESNGTFGEPNHGNAGLLEVTSPFHLCAMTKAYIDAVQSLGVPKNADFNGGRQLGVGLMQNTIGRNRRRCSAVDAFLGEVIGNPKLTLMTNSAVQKINIEGGSAESVDIRRGGETIRAYSRNEIILTAGAYITPQLLMLSGIGPADHLGSHGIVTITDLPGVGANLQDHCEVPIVAASNGRYGYFGEDAGWRMIRNGLQYLLFKSGPVTTIGVEACAFINPDSDGGDAKLKIYCVPTVYLDRDISGVDPCDGLTMTCCILRPQSRGSVRLRSANPVELPLVDGGFLRHPADLELLTKGLKFARRIAQTEPIQSKLAYEILPGRDATSDKQLAAHCKKTVKTNYHPVGTCKMGRTDDPLAVVDSDLKALGVNNLRIFDTSIMPSIVSGNTNAPAMAIADLAVSRMMA